MYKNKVVRVALSGGIIGALTTNPRRALANVIEAHNNEGYRVQQILDHSTHNVFMLFLSVVVLCCTLFLWTFGAGYLVLFEKDEKN